MMDANQRMIEATKNGVLSKFPLLGSVMASLSIKADSQIQTAATDGIDIFYSPDYLQKLTHEERVFVLAHEIMHVAFDHILRGQDKDPETWNEATDAVINQMLKQANLPLPKDAIDIPNAIDKSANEIYDAIWGGEKTDQQDNAVNQNGQGEGQSGQQPTNHNLWEEAAKQIQANNDGKKIPYNEKNFTEANEKVKSEIGKKIREQLEQESSQAKEAGQGEGGEKRYLGDVGNVTKPVISWQSILRRELDLEEERWSYRRAKEENDFQPRLEDLEICDLAEVEVLLDTSGSVDDKLLKSFLRQIKHIVKDAKLKVGCFDTNFYGFHEVKRVKDIDNFPVVGRGGTDFDLALASFSKNRSVNKIIFTDGFDKVTETNENKKIKNLYWLVWANDLFKPCCGRVIFVDRYAIDYQTKKLSTCTLQTKKSQLNQQEQVK